MSSLRDDHLMPREKSEERPVRHQRCWEYLACTTVLCPAHGEYNQDCWLVPGTVCSQPPGGDFFLKLYACLSCAYFKERGFHHPGGNDYFLASQLQRYNYTAMEQIYQKEESFVEVLNRIPDGVFTTDNEWRITYFNPAAEKITGFSSIDAIGMYCKDVFKNDICETDCALRKAVDVGYDIHNKEYVITNIEGKKIPVLCSTSAFRDRHGKIVGGLEIFKDLSELKNLQRELIERDKKYRRLFEESHDMIYSSNLEGDLLTVNKAGVEMLGYCNREDLLGIGSAKRLYRNPKDRLKFLNLINSAGSVKDFEVDFVRKDGTPIHVLVSAKRYDNHKTGKVEYEGIIKDITQRKRVEEDLKRRNRDLSILNSVAVALNLTMDINHILNETLKNVLDALALKRGAVFLIDRDQHKATIRVSYGLPVEDSQNKEGIVFKDVELKRHLIQKNVHLTPEPAFPKFYVKYQGKNGAEVPWLSAFLITFKGEAIGFFGLDIPDDHFLSQHEIGLIGSLGNFLGGSIQNARMMETIRNHRQELRGLTEKLFQSQEDERRRIARELHDEAGQSLTAVKLGLDRLEDKVRRNPELKSEIDEIRKMLMRTSSEIRRLSYHLHPTVLSDLGLEPALNLLFKQLEKHTMLDIDFHMVGFDERIDRETETVLYRFSQEALTNVLKHSGAEHFRLSIIRSYPKIIFLAEDDGLGFHGNLLSDDKRSLGLIGMRERVSMLGGTFQLKSREGSGTRIRIEIPLNETASYEQSN